MITLLITLSCVIAWAVTSRALFRYWVRNDTFTQSASECSHGYSLIHQGNSCHPERPASHGRVASIAVVAGLFLPVTLFIIFIMSNPPLGRQALAEKIAALEAENSKLRASQNDTH